MKFGVITRVPEPPDAGNMALTIPYVVTEQPDESNGWLGRVEVARLGPAVLNFRGPVFALGEILVLDGDGREFTGRGRKPNKWDVDCREFDDIQEALDCALALPA